MGAETSHLVDPDTPPQTLKERTLEAVADLIKSGDAKRIVVLTGAGLSTAAGIPDFRSPGTGLYNNLQRLNLPYAEAVFEIGYFRENPLPFYALAKELYPGNFSPTISHVFINLLAKKHLLRMLFTQNIDCLERQAGVPGELIVEAHGSFATQHCIDCRAEFPDKEMHEYVERGEPPRCKSCGGLVKPDIVFFGESLPDSFFLNRTVPTTSDLMFVIGTSLTVAPFSHLPMLAPEGCPRVLFNRDRVGDLGSRTDDVLCLEDCDSGVRKLADLLGWREELDKLWRQTVGEREAERQLASVQARQAEIEEEVARLAKNVEERLEISGQPENALEANEDQVENEEAGQGAPEVQVVGSGALEVGATGESEKVARAPSVQSVPQTQSGEGDREVAGELADAKTDLAASQPEPHGEDTETVKKTEQDAYVKQETVHDKPAETNGESVEHKHEETVETAPAVAQVTQKPEEEKTDETITQTESATAPTVASVIEEEKKDAA